MHMLLLLAHGNLDEMEDFPEKIYKAVCEKCGNKDIKNAPVVDNIIENCSERIIKQDIAQSVLCIGLKATNVTKEDMYALLLYNAILGGSPASKLFQNVREKESLAYFAKASYNRFKNAIYMYAGVDPKKEEKAKEVMIYQTEIIKNKDVSDIEFEAAKQSLISNYIEMEDTKETLIRTIMNNELFFGREVNIEEMIDKIKGLTKEDVTRVANNIIISNVFILGGRAND